MINFKNYTEVTKIVIPDSVQLSDCNFNNAFSNMKNLQVVNLSNKVTNISYAYRNCTNLTTAVCGDNVTNMSGAYYVCSNLTTAVCGPNVTNMSNAYSDCINLTTAVCGPNVTNMSYAYSGCDNLCGNVVFYSDFIRNVKGCFRNRSSTLPQINIFVYKNSITWNTIFNNTTSNSITAKNISWQQQENYYYEPNSNIYLYSIE